VPFDRDKFKTLVHYVCWKVDNPVRLGAVKLNKVLWFSDLATYLYFNNAITGARYVKRQFGPVPAAILPVVEELKNEGSIAVRDVDYHNKPKREFFALKRPDIRCFSSDEISVVDLIIEAVCDRHTAASISELTHNESWEIAEVGEELPLYTVFSAQRGEIDENDVQWADAVIGRVRAA
jgi:hypothetical protein